MNLQQLILFPIITDAQISAFMLPSMTWSHQSKCFSEAQTLKYDQYHWNTWNYMKMCTFTLHFVSGWCWDGGSWEALNSVFSLQTDFRPVFNNKQSVLSEWIMKRVVHKADEHQNKQKITLISQIETGEHPKIQKKKQEA